MPARIPPSRIRVLYFAPGPTGAPGGGAAPVFRLIPDTLADYRELLGSGPGNSVGLDPTLFVVQGRLYHLWCDDDACAKGLAPCRQLCYPGRYDGWILRGPFFFTRIHDGDDVSVGEDDYPALVDLAAPLPEGVTP